MKVPETKLEKPDQALSKLAITLKRQSIEEIGKLVSENGYKN